VNHANLAREALRFRLETLSTTLVDPRYDIDAAASFAVSCADPAIDGAIRRIGTAWTRAGLDPERICEPWRSGDVRRLLAAGGPDVIDALDDIVGAVSRRAVFT
jgi:hypothetical protein